MNQEKACKQQSSMVSESVPIDINSYHVCLQWQVCDLEVIQMNRLLLNLLWSWYFITERGKHTRTSRVWKWCSHFHINLSLSLSNVQVLLHLLFADPPFSNLFSQFLNSLFHLLNFLFPLFLFLLFPWPLFLY